MNKKFLLIFLVLCLAGFFVFGAWGAEQDLVIAFDTLGEELWLAPMTLRSFYQDNAIYSNLLERDKDTGKIVAGKQGALAESYTASEDRTVFTFNLVKGAQFHKDWGEVSSADVKFSFELSWRPESTNQYGGQLHKALESIETPDDYTVIFRFKEPQWGFTDILTNVFQYMGIASKKYVEQVGIEEAQRNPIGSGPFQFKEHIPGVRFVVEAVKDHWYQTPKLETITWVVIPDPATRLMMVRSGEAHLTGITYDQIKEAINAGLRIYSMKGTSLLVLHFHGIDYPFEARKYSPEDTPVWAKGNFWELESPAFKVRKALSLAIDRKSIVDELLQGYGSLEGVSQYPWFPSHEDYIELPPDPYDLQLAVKLIEEAGYKPSEIKVEMELTPHPARPYNRPISEAIAAMWEKIGINVSTRLASDYTTHTKTTGDRAATYAWTWPAPITGYAMGHLTSVAGPNSYVNFAGNTPELAELMARAAEAKTYDEMIERNQAVERYMYDRRLTLSIAYAANLFAAEKNFVWPIMAGASGVQTNNYVNMYFENTK